MFQLSQLRAQASKLGAQLANMREETRDKLGIAVRDAMPGLTFKLASLVPPLSGSRWTCESSEVSVSTALKKKMPSKGITFSNTTTLNIKSGGFKIL